MIISFDHFSFAGSSIIPPRLLATKNKPRPSQYLKCWFNTGMIFLPFRPTFKSALLVGILYGMKVSSDSFSMTGRRRAFIGDHFTSAHIDAFERCYHPAMRCDYFRLCYTLFRYGGFYVDADEVYQGSSCEVLLKTGRLKLQPLCYDIESEAKWCHPRHSGWTSRALRIAFST